MAQHFPLSARLRAPLAPLRAQSPAPKACATREARTGGLDPWPQTEPNAYLILGILAREVTVDGVGWRCTALLLPQCSHWSWGLHSADPPPTGSPLWLHFQTDLLLPHNFCL